jgi:hypothetical protein
LSPLDFSAANSLEAADPIFRHTKKQIKIKVLSSIYGGLGTTPARPFCVRPRHNRHKSDNLRLALWCVLTCTPVGVTCNASKHGETQNGSTQKPEEKASRPSYGARPHIVGDA